MLARNLVSVVAWVVFFASSAYGHVALKIAVDGRSRLVLGMTSPLALSAYAAWGVSSLLWAFVLSRHSLLAANGISAIRYIAVAACAALVLRESFGPKQIAGTLLVVAGVFLIGRG